MHDCGVYIVENSTLYGQIILTGCIFVMGIEPRSRNPQLTEVLSWFAVICYVVHTSYLSFPLHRQDFQIQNFTPRNNSNLPQKVKYVVPTCTECGRRSKAISWEVITNSHPHLLYTLLLPTSTGNGVMWCDMWYAMWCDMWCWWWYDMWCEWYVKYGGGGCGVMWCDMIYHIYVVWMLFEILTTEHCKSFKVKFTFHYFLQPFSTLPTLQWFHVLPAKIPTMQALPRIVIFYTNHHSSEDSMYILIGF